MFRSPGPCSRVRVRTFKVCRRTIASAAWPELMLDRLELTVLRLLRLIVRPLTPLIADTWLMALPSVIWLAWLAAWLLAWLAATALSWLDTWLMAEICDSTDCSAKLSTDSSARLKCVFTLPFELAPPWPRAPREPVLPLPRVPPLPPLW